jgi:hypothetical protein
MEESEVPRIRLLLMHSPPRQLTRRGGAIVATVARPMQHLIGIEIAPAIAMRAFPKW